MTSERVFVDFQKTDQHNGHLVPTVGTRKDLERLGITLVPGLMVSVYDADGDGFGNRDDLIADAIAVWEPVAERWTLEPVEESVCHESDVRLDKRAAEENAYGG